jgi:two-component system KDP operon response regulator KdpE
MVRLLKANLEARDFSVFTALDGGNAIRAVEMYQPDVIILDIMLPVVDGREVCTRIREWYKGPIIILSALARTIDKTQCLDLGADDYVTKPFAVEELLARTRAVLRRAKLESAATSPTFKCGNLVINFAQRSVALGGSELSLTQTEFLLLQELVLNADRVLTHSQLLNKIWGMEYTEDKEYLRDYISHLRAKLDADAKKEWSIVTVKGVGYMFKNAVPV